MGKTTMEVPCRGCKFREVACHGKCESYLDYVRAIRYKMRKARYGCTVRD